MFADVSRKSYVSSSVTHCPLSWILDVNTMCHVVVHVSGEKTLSHVSMEPFLLERVPWFCSPSILGQRQREEERKKTVVATIPAFLIPIKESKVHQRARTRLVSLMGDGGPASARGRQVIPLVRARGGPIPKGPRSYPYFLFV